MQVEKLVPEVYYRESRDFAYIARVIELALNYMKTAANCVNVNFDAASVDANSIELLADTLGFDAQHEYIAKDLMYVASSFSELLRLKGTDTAINLAIKLLLNSQGIRKSSKFDFVSTADSGELEIKLPEDLKDIILLEDLFDYILPVGMTYLFTSVAIGNNNFVSEATSDTEIDIKYKKDPELGYVTQETSIAISETDSIPISDYNIGTIATGLIVSENLDDHLEN